MEGVFLKRSRVRKNPPDERVPVYWKAEDFTIGTDITIHGHRFTMLSSFAPVVAFTHPSPSLYNVLQYRTGQDQYTTNIMEGDTARFRRSDLDSIMARLRSKLYEKRVTPRVVLPCDMFLMLCLLV